MGYQPANGGRISLSQGRRHEKALEKSGEESGEEFEKYKLAQKTIGKEQSLKEIEEDIKKLKN